VVSEGIGMNKNQLRLFPREGNNKKKAVDMALADKVTSTKDYVSSIWSFSGSSGAQLYRWYGTLPRPLVERLITMYARSGSRILDPFMGTGTTLDVAAEIGLPAKGIDNNPLSCLISEVRLDHTISGQPILKAADMIANKLGLPTWDRPKSENRQWEDYVLDRRYQYTRKWFRKDSLNALLALLFEIAELDDERTQRLLFVAAAQTARDVASVDSRCTHHLVTKKKDFINPVPLWMQEVNLGLEAVRKTQIDNSKISITQGSILEYALEKESADFALIHPPYLGMIHYNLIHRLATDLLDVVKRAKMPASLNKYDFRYERIRETDVSTDNEKQYKFFIERLAEIMQKVVSPNGCCAVIIGDQRYKGKLRHPFADFIHFFENNGFALEENFIWILQNNAGMHVLRRGHFIDHNYIMVFRRIV
jgi:DNA modification methylase